MNAGVGMNENVLIGKRSKLIKTVIIIIIQIISFN